MRGQQRHDPLPGCGPVVEPRLKHDGRLAEAEIIILAARYHY
jgi:hypothetical protein